VRIGFDRLLAAGLQQGSPAQQLPTDAARQVRRFASTEFCRCKATHHGKNPLTLQPDFLPINWYC